MSLIKSLGKVVGSVARVAAPVVSVFNPALGVAVGAAGMLGQRSSSPLSLTGAMPAMPGPGVLNLLPALGPIAGAAGRVAVAGARSAMQGAVAWCRRNPSWCASIGGTAAVAAMIESGQLPMPRRRRGRGLSSRDLRGFRKTVRLIRATAGSVGLRGRSRSRAGGSSSTLIAQN